VGCVVQGVRAGDELAIDIPSLHWTVRVVQCDHRVPSVGYAIEEKRSKLKEEYHGLSGKEIAALKKSGVEITHLETTKQFVFMGDTTVRVFEDHPEVLEYPLIFIECTLFGDSKLEQNARNTTHVHWNFLKPIVKANPQCLFMLIHFSLRWNEHQIEEYFDEQVKEEGITNLGLWLDKGVKDYSRPAETNDSANESDSK